MSSRRDFLKQAALLAASGSLSGALPGSIQKAFAIDPAPGSTFLDAEHIVVLMQENRSFDHTYGTLRGVRGYNDPRAITLPSGNPVWLQQDAQGDTYAPFRFDIKNTKATWMGSLPHGWVDQGAARNNGRHDGWLPAKACTSPEYAHLPLTLGYYTREDIPFYYALADAFTICDQNFCSSLTPTEPNRLHLWTGTVRPEPNATCKAYVENSDMGYDKQLSWTTFPDRLEKHEVSWKIYQNELSLPTGLSDEHDSWLSNFDDNPLEYFVQYNVRFLRSHRQYLVETEQSLTQQLARLHALPASEKEAKQIADLTVQLAETRRDLATFTDEAFAALPLHEQNLHRKGFTTNDGDPAYRELTSMSYRDGETEREMQIPKGDVLYQFREDVRTGKLPTISWIIAPERFSDHPSSAWYGAWYLSETMDILTRDPEVWKKTILILCYDENDGYYDHVPPYVPPQHGCPETGKASVGIDTSVEFVTAEQEAQTRKEEPDWQGVPGPIGLGFRVPLIIASPWSRGGYVNSQVFDHTSILKFMEVFLSHKIGTPIQETNISSWRRTVCGDLTSAFRPYHGEPISLPPGVNREQFFSSIYEAQFKPLPNDYGHLEAGKIAHVRENPLTSRWLPPQESGARNACALPYELTADGGLSEDRRSFVIEFAAGNAVFGERAAGAAFRVYAPGLVRPATTGAAAFERGRAWDYAVVAGDQLSDTYSLTDFEAGRYHLRVDGPNGFFREFRGSAADPLLTVKFVSRGDSRAPGGDAEVQLVNRDPHRPLSVIVEQPTYTPHNRILKLEVAGSRHATATVPIRASASHGWHDVRVRVNEAPEYEQRFAGRIETGKESLSDPYMARVERS